MADKRVIEQTASSEIYNDDWFLKDSVLNGTTKISAENLAKGLIDNVDASDIAYDNSESGLTATNVQDAIDETFENAGKVDDVKVDGVSVVDENKVAQITTPDADGISYDNTTSGLEADDVQEAIDEVVTDVESVETALETKAEVDGFYDELFAGNLLSDTTTSDTTPYLYRQSPSGKSAVDLSVVGGTVAWNQLVQNGNFADNSGWSSYQCTFSVNNNVGVMTLGASSYSYAQINRIIKIPANHKVFIQLSASSSADGKMSYTAYTVLSGGTRTMPIVDVNLQSNVWANHSKIVQMGSADTNYLIIYANTVESSTTSLKNVNIIDLTQAFGTTIADYIYSLEQAEAGSGIAWLKSYGFLTKDYYAYDSGSLQSVNVSSRKVYDSNDTLVATYPLDSDLTLRGIPKLDSNNNFYYDGDIYESDGSVTRRFGVVDLGSLTWSHASSNRSISNAIANTIKKPATQTSLANLLTANIYTQVPSNTSLNTNGQFAISQSGDMIFYYDGVNEPKGYMVYELATPTSETVDAYENPQLVGSTEEFVDTRNVPIPVGGERKYYTDLKAKLEELAKIPDVPSTNGTYTLKATRSASGVAYNWISG